MSGIQVSPPPGAAASVADLSVVPSKLSDLARAPWAGTGVIASTIDLSKAAVNVGTHALVSGTLKLSGCPVIPAGRQVTNIKCLSGSTAAATCTHCWFCLVDRALNVLAKTVDDTAASPWAANTLKTLALAAPYTPVNAIEVYVGIVVVGTTMPTLDGLAAPATPYATTGRGGYSTTGLTDPASLGATAAALTLTTASVPMVYAELT